MLEVLQFVLGGFWRFLGTVILLGIALRGLALVVVALAAALSRK